jgi:hypothetical protein
MENKGSACIIIVDSESQRKSRRGDEEIGYEEAIEGYR